MTCTIQKTITIPESALGNMSYRQFIKEMNLNYQLFTSRDGVLTYTGRK